MLISAAENEKVFFPIIYQCNKPVCSCCNIVMQVTEVDELEKKDTTHFLKKSSEPAAGHP